MAYKMKLTTPHKGMPFIWNVSAEIGPYEGLSNNKTDIELFQRLLITKRVYAPTKYPLCNAIHKISPNGIMDTITGLEVFNCACLDELVQHSRVISPAKQGKVSYNADRMWTIAYLNFRLFQLNRTVWESFPETCSPILKQQLTMSSP
jgi:hypothetical protein